MEPRTRKLMKITAEVIQDSLMRCRNDSNRLTTLKLEFPRFILAELLTHRVFSRNASSSRAIPVKTMLNTLKASPAMPIHWGKNKSGMQADREHNALIDVAGHKMKPEDAWLTAMESAAYFAEQFANAGYHKQVVNRLTEPFQMMCVIVSATEFENFMWLRDHSAAQPEIQELAQVMKNAMLASTPLELNDGQWHVPFVDRKIMPSGLMRYFVAGYEVTLDKAKQISSSVCAQTSFRKSDFTMSKAKKIFDMLINGERLHASPFEHQATPMEYNEYVNRMLMSWEYEDKSIKSNCNFIGWTQYRRRVEGELCQ